LKTVIVTKDLGGQLSSTLEIANYPGINFIEGYSLAEVMAEQARHAGATIVVDEISSLSASGGNQPRFVATGAQDSYSGRSLILALGKTPRGLGLPDEERYLGKGVGYCAPSDIRAAAGQQVVIVGGGGTAFAAAKLGSSIASKITLIHRNETFRAEKAVVDEVRQLPNVEIITNAEVTALHGTPQLSDITITRSDGSSSMISCDHLLIGAGFTVHPELYQELVATNELGLITVNERQETSRPGLYAAGDISSVPFNQAVISASEGAKAALSAYSWLTGKPAGSDWH
jgi:thioredoxin reductase (NADPH)